MSEPREVREEARDWLRVWEEMSETKPRHATTDTDLAVYRYLLRLVEADLERNPE